MFSEIDEEYFDEQGGLWAQIKSDKEISERKTKNREFVLESKFMILWERIDYF